MTRVVRTVAILSVLALAACPSGSGSRGGAQAGSQTGSQTAPKDPGSAAVKMTPEAGSGSFVKGPSVTPGDQLIAWLEQQVFDGEPRLVRLPLVLKKDGYMFSTRGARIGAAEGAVEVYANDAALGIGLADRARSQCKNADSCAMWIEGYWRGKQDGDYTVDVMTVVGPIAADELAAASFAEVQGESGN